jgi:hypothetical protein
MLSLSYLLPILIFQRAGRSDGSATTHAEQLIYGKDSIKITKVKLFLEKKKQH